MNLPPGALTVWAYAARRGTSTSAVRERIEAGKLPSSTKRIKGRWVIADAALADAEWAANVRPWVRSEAATPGRGSPLAAVTLRERKARAERLEFELAQRRGHFVPAREVEQRWSTLIVNARTGLLGIPTRAKGRLPHLTAADLAGLEALIREVLLELAESPPARVERGPRPALSRAGSRETPAPPNGHPPPTAKFFDSGTTPIR